MAFFLHSPSGGLNKVFKLGLWSTWFCGLLLISLSLYATQLLPSIGDDLRRPYSFGSTNGTTAAIAGNPTITIFSAPSYPFTGSDATRHSQAIRSWLGLSPLVNVLLFGNHPSLQSFAASFGYRVSVEPSIDFSFTGTPFFHSMIMRAQMITSDISILIDPETILLRDFFSTLNYAYDLDHDWFVIASPRKISYLPFALDELGKGWRSEDGEEIKLKKLQDIISRDGQWDYSEKRTLMAWNNRDLPLHMGVVPPFLYKRGIHNHWLINEVFHSNFRFLFDASWATTSFYLSSSDDNRESQQYSGIYNDTDLKRRGWEYEENLYIGELYGLLNFREANFSDFVKLLNCGGGKYLFTNTALDTVYSFGERSSGSMLKQSVLQLRKERRILNCIASLNSLNRTGHFSPKSNLDRPVSIQLPFELESVLKLVVDSNKTVVLAVAGYSYKDLLMSWVCRLRKLQITNFLVCALDEAAYEFSVLQGLPVYKDPLAPSNISFDNCHFGTECFQKVTKRKSRLVLQILKLGYNVLMSDVDVYWFKNPIPLLRSFGPGVLVAQSDEYKLTGPVNLPRRLNSGFYFAHSDESTIAGVEKVVKHALTSELSEQPSYYDMLCGEGGSNRVGDDKCFEPETNLTVQFLDRDLFPNGAYRGLWEEDDVRAACEKKGCYVLHNNWINGRLKKLERQVASGLWDFDISSRMCLQRWHQQRSKMYI